MPQIDREGIFRAKPIDIGIRENKKESQVVMIGIQFQITQCLEGENWVDWTGYGFDAYGNFCLVKKDGTVNDMTVTQFVEGLGWDCDHAKLASGFDARECQIRVKQNVYEGKTSYRAEWISDFDADPSGSMKKMEPAAGAAKLARHAAAFRAIGSGANAPTPPPPATPPKSPPPPPPKGNGGPPAPSVAHAPTTATRDEAWAAFVATGEGGRCASGAVAGDCQPACAAEA